MNKEMKRRRFIHVVWSTFLLSGLHSTALGLGYGSPSVQVMGNSNADAEKLQALIRDKSKPIRWVFAGDSITQGAKHTAGYRSYPEIFAERIRFEMNRSRDIVINSAISGQVASDILSDFDWRINQFHPEVVSLMIGVNDAAAIRQISASTFEKNISKLIHKIRDIHAIPILNTPNTIAAENTNPQRKKLPDFVKVLRTVAQEMDVVLIDHWSHWEANELKLVKENWLADPLHPSPMGQLELAREFFRALNICDNQSFTCTGRVNFK